VAGISPRQNSAGSQEEDPQGGLTEELEGSRAGERIAMLHPWRRPVLARRLADGLADGLADRVVVGLAGHLAGRFAGGVADALAGLGLFFDSF
jgi:hypothetical protein